MTRYTPYNKDGRGVLRGPSRSPTSSPVLTLKALQRLATEIPMDVLESSASPVSPVDALIHPSAKVPPAIDEFLCPPRPWTEGYDIFFKHFYKDPEVLGIIKASRKSISFQRSHIIPHQLQNDNLQARLRTPCTFDFEGPKNVVVALRTLLYNLEKLYIAVDDFHEYITIRELIIENISSTSTGQSTRFLIRNYLKLVNPNNFLLDHPAYLAHKETAYPILRKYCNDRSGYVEDALTRYLKIVPRPLTEDQNHILDTIVEVQKLLRDDFGGRGRTCWGRKARFEVLKKCGVMEDSLFWNEARNGCNEGINASPIRFEDEEEEAILKKIRDQIREKYHCANDLAEFCHIKKLVSLVDLKLTDEGVAQLTTKLIRYLNPNNLHITRNFTEDDILRHFEKIRHENMKHISEYERYKRDLPLFTVTRLNAEVTSSIIWRGNGWVNSEVCLPYRSKRSLREMREKYIELMASLGEKFQEKMANEPIEKKLYAKMKRKFPILTAKYEELHPISTAATIPNLKEKSNSISSTTMPVDTAPPVKSQAHPYYTPPNDTSPNTLESSPTTTLPSDSTPSTPSSPILSTKKRHYDESDVEHPAKHQELEESYISVECMTCCVPFEVVGVKWVGVENGEEVGAECPVCFTTYKVVGVKRVREEEDNDQAERAKRSRLESEDF